MKNATLDRWVWILIYGGLLVGVLGLAPGARDGGLGHLLRTGGVSAVALGVVLLVWRSRRSD